MIITIDGPTASGKSSVAQLLAERLSYYYLYTGLLYRALAYIRISKAESTPIKDILTNGSLQYSYTHPKVPQILFNGLDITSYLKSAEIDRYASILSADPVVRTLLLDFQRKLGMCHSLVADGRDCGTIVFPHADYKFFLTAHAEVRAARWQKSQVALNNYFTLEESLSIIQERDERDSNRAHAPLIKAPDAYIIDNSNLDLLGTLNMIVQYSNGDRI